MRRFVVLLLLALPAAGQQNAYVIDMDGKAVAMLDLRSGKVAGKAPERKPSELIRLDTSTGQVAGRIAFDAAAQAFATDASGTTGIVYSPPYPKKKPSPLPARVMFVDLAGFKVGPTIDLAGEVRKPAAVGDRLYVLDAGNKKQAGHLYIIDTKSQSLVKTLPLGSEAVLAGTDDQGRVIVLSQGADKKSGRVMLVKGLDVVGDYAGPEAPKFVTTSPDRKRLYIAGWKDFSLLDMAGKKASEAVELARDPFAVLATKDGKRAFVVSKDGESCCRITAFDAENMKRLTSFLGGSKGERFGQSLAAAALTAASYQAGRSYAQSSGSNAFFYSIYTPTARGAARGPLAFSPDEKKVYLVDTQTNDVTVVDVATGERLKNVDSGSGLKEVVPLYEAGVLAAISDEDVRLIDLNTDEVLQTIKLSGNVVDALLTPDEKRLVIFGKGRVVVLDAVTGKEVARTETLKQPVQVLFGKSP